MIPIERIVADDDFNCRGSFQLHTVRELADDIAVNGLLHPPVVRPLPDGRYSLVVGFRRLAAVKLLGWTQVPVTIRDDLADKQAQGVNLAENIQRRDLNC